MALLKQSVMLAETFSKAASVHQTTALASVVGTIKTNSSGLNDQAAPMKELHTAASGMVSDKDLNTAAKSNTTASDSTAPHH